MKTLARPFPPKFDEFSAPDFVPAPELDAWIKQTFLNEKSILFNPEHDHLNSAHVGYLWSFVPNESQGRIVAGTAEMPRPKGNKWQIARQLWQLEQWFGDVPDFVITVSAPIIATAPDASFCALVEHEMYHCAQATDIWGFPKFRRTTGRPVFTMRGHDVEEFIGVVARYGAAAASANVLELVEAANREPELLASEISLSCGLCLSK